LNKRFRWLLSAALAFTLALAGVALAHTAPWDDGVVDSAKEEHGHKHGQHGDEGGHLPSTQQNMELISKLKLKNVVPEKIADVGVYKGYAYLAAWGVVTCKYNGVHVVNIKDPANPREVAFIGAKHGSYPGEGIQALSLDTAAYKGDILVSNNEKCSETSGFGGMNIYDISNPKAPTPLYEGFGDDAVNGTGKKDGHEIHSVFAWNDVEDNRAYAVMVDNEEAEDVDIVDITNPKRPKLIAEYDMVADFPEAGVDQAGMPENFHHDMIVKKIGDRYVMLISYWDSGYIQLDVTNPKAAEYISDSDYAAIDPEAAESGLTVPPEGNGHQAEFTKNNDYIIATDEDFDPYKLVAQDDEGQPFDGTMGISFPPGSELPSDVVYVGQACTAASVAPASTTEGQIALVERGTCFFQDKYDSIAAQGYDAMIVFNSEDGDPPCTGLINMLVDGTVPSFFVGRQTGFDLMDQTYDDAVCKDPDASQTIAAAPGTVFPNAVTISSYFDGWGYVHLFDANTMEDLDTYAVPEAHLPSHASGFGDLSIHEVATSKVSNDLAYYAYYSAGVRVTRIEDGELVEKGHFIDEGGSNFWGIEVFKDDGQEYVAASDRDHGLYILKYIGD
jgi:hypothetical protein